MTASTLLASVPPAASFSSTVARSATETAGGPIFLLVAALESRTGGTGALHRNHIPSIENHPDRAFDLAGVCTTCIATGPLGEENRRLRPAQRPARDSAVTRLRRRPIPSLRRAGSDHCRRSRPAARKTAPTMPQKSATTCFRRCSRASSLSPPFTDSTPVSRSTL